MQEFINWGGETPEQLAERRRFEEEMREFAINKMLMEAAQSRSSSATAAIGGGGGGVQSNNNTILLAYINQTTGNWEYFTGNPSSTTFTEVIDTGILGESSLDQIYPLNQSGYILVFRNSDSSVTAICLTADGREISRVSTIPTTDASYYLLNGRFFVMADFDDNKFWIFDGTSVRLDETILSGATSFSIGTDLQPITAHSKLIVSVVRVNDERGQYKEWWAVDAQGSSIFLTDFFEETGETYSIAASWQANHLVKTKRDYATSQPKEISIIDITGESITSHSLIDSISFNYYFYGISGSILITVRFAENYTVISFDPNLAESDQVQVIELSIDAQGTNIIETVDGDVWFAGNETNFPSETFAILISVPGQTAIGSLTDISSASVISKFAGQTAQNTPLEIGYIDVSNIYVSTEAILLPISYNGDTFQILRATSTSTFETTVTDISIDIDSIQSLNLNRVANGFLLQVALGTEERSYLEFIDESGNLPENSYLDLEDFYYPDGDWYDEAGPLLYYSDRGIHAWLPVTKEWVRVVGDREGINRYTTRARYSADLRDGLNYLLIGAGARLYWFNDYGTNGINDGGNDMYDTANELYIGSNGNQLPYTHTQSQDDANDTNEVTDIELFTMDGTVNSGSAFEFGENSEYFTNTYPGLFIMSAVNVETDAFEIDGNIGSDGDGLADSGQIDLTETGYTLFYKRVWGAGDPSINQLIIVKSTDASQIVQEIDTTTEDDFHKISQLDQAGVSQIHYLLFALASGVQASLETLTDLANTYVNLVKTDLTAEDVLATVNSNYQSLLGQLPPHTSSGDRQGYLVGEQSITEFEVLNTDLDTIRLGDTGFLIISFNSEREGLATLDYYNLQGTRVTRVETNENNVMVSNFVNDRAVALLQNTESEGGVVYIFNGSGYASREIESLDSWYDSLNDSTWFD